MAKEPKIVKVYVTRPYRQIVNGVATVVKPKQVLELQEHDAADVVSAGKAEIFNPEKHGKKESK